MKKIIFTFGILLSFFAVKAQITLTENNVQWVSDNNWNVCSVASVIIPSEGENQTWDYSGLSITNSSVVRTYEANQNEDFPNSQFLLQDNIHIGSLLIPRQYYYGVTEAGFFCEGATTDEYKLPLQSITGNVVDSLIFEEQTDVWDPFKYYLQFPCTYNTAWEMEHVPATNFKITVTAFGLNKTPGSHKQYCTGSRDVVGWGSLVVPAGEFPSIPYDVLLLKYHLNVIDSFFIAGNPAPAALLGALNLTQGNETDFYTYEFWRENYNEEILSFNMNADYTTTNNIILTTRDIQNSINNITNQQISFYPNPSSTIIYLNKPASFDIYDLFGRKILSFTNVSQANIEMLNAGIYLIKTADGFIQKLIVN